MLTLRRAGLLAIAGVSLAVCGGDAQDVPAPGMVVSSDPDLRAMAESLLPDLARRSGLELKEPVRLEMRTRAELVRYLEAKLDEELPPDEARTMVAAYSLLGLVPDTLDLRALLLGLYTEQVAGFYEPDSTALFVLDDQPAESLQGLLVHELVHAVQDQSADLHALTDPSVGNDRATAAQAAIEGHATLVMLEYMTEQMSGTAVDLGRLPNFSETLAPTLEAMAGEFPALAGAPRVIRESLLFPYVAGAAYVQALWTGAEREAPFGANLPASTEQIIKRSASDAPTPLTLTIEGAEVLETDDLGQLEMGVFIDTWAGGGSGGASGWDGDRYALVAAPEGGHGLILATVWDDVAARDRFVSTLRPHLFRLPRPSALEARELAGGRAGAVLTIGVPDGVRIGVEPAGAP